MASATTQHWTVKRIVTAEWGARSFAGHQSSGLAQSFDTRPIDHRQTKGGFIGAG